MGGAATLPGEGVVVIATEGADVDAIGVVVACLGSEASEIKNDADLATVWVEKFGIGSATPGGFAVGKGVGEVIREMMEDRVFAAASEARGGTFAFGGRGFFTATSVFSLCTKKLLPNGGT